MSTCLTHFVSLNPDYFVTHNGLVIAVGLMVVSNQVSNFFHSQMMKLSFQIHKFHQLDHNHRDIHILLKNRSQENISNVKC